MIDMAIQTRTIEYTHEGVLLEGFLAWDDAHSGPRPGILVAHAFRGRDTFECQRAEDLAALGYVGFALDLYGKGVLAENTEQASALMTTFLEDRVLLQSRLQAAVELVAEQPEVDAGKGANIKPCVLVEHGWDDPMVPPEQVVAFTEEMTAASADWQLHGHGGAVHAFTNPAANDPDFGTVYNAAAQRRSWQSLENFLTELF
jgi:dienelactone hydrolase